MSSSLRTRPRRALAASTALLLLLLSSCSSDGGDATGATTTDATAAVDTTATDAAVTSTTDEGTSDDTDDASDDTGADEGALVLTVDGTEVALSGTCSYDPSDLTVAGVAFAQASGTDDEGEPYGVQFSVSGSRERRTQVRVALPDDSYTVAWEQDGSLSQSSDEGSYVLGDGAVEITVVTPAGDATVVGPCTER
ncbi:MAG: hypothetical protein KF906_12485 [Actinobacteria bacterium]|nr:hypothetical protein [Actinomycetota bacterium]